MSNTLDKLQTLLFSASDGRDACEAINQLAVLAQAGTEAAKKVLALYVAQGSINHMRGYACARLAEAIKEPHAEFAALFLKCLADPELRYWSILGYVNSAGKAAYEHLMKMAEDERLPLAERAQAIKCLARFSRQLLDRGLAADPGHWKQTDLRLSELRAWAECGYPDGPGYRPPARHAALDNPVSPLEKIVSRLDKKLARKRQERQDLADPTEWLAIAAPDDIQRIKARWKLPATFLDFLTSFSPIKVTIKNRKFYNHFQLFGAGELIAAQEGYSFNPIEQRPIDDWPAHLVVIASHGGDPFALDLSNTDGEDAPVDTAEHGAGVWEFEREADSFKKFLKLLAK